MNRVLVLSILVVLALKIAEVSAANERCSRILSELS